MSSSLQVLDLLEHYTTQVKQTSDVLIPSLVHQLNQAIDNGSTPKEFILNGNSKELKCRRLTDEYAAYILSPLKGTQFLFRLELNYNELTDTTAHLIASFLETSRTLQTLHMASNNIGAEGIAAICRALHLNESLLQLNINHNKAEEIGGMAIASMLQVNRTISSLHIKNNYLSASALIAIATTLHQNSSLTFFDISENGAHLQAQSTSLHSDTLHHLGKALIHNQNIQTIDLSRMAIADVHLCDEGMASILAKQQFLTCLNLSANKIRRDGAVALANGWLHFDNEILTHLDLSYNAIHDEGCVAMADFLKKNMSIQTLNISHNKIGPIGLVHLNQILESKNKTVQKLYLWENLFDTNTAKLWKHLIAIKHRFEDNMIDIAFYDSQGETHIAHQTVDS